LDKKKKILYNAFIHACIKGDLNNIKKLLIKDIYYNHNNCTVLHLACHNGYIDLIKLLIDKCADVNIKDNNGEIGLIKRSY
jgi:ankyrin repeat protein